ncbi:ion channel [Pseudoalteromonas sp. SSMSWG5]|jgi:voltage-gated potassium channel|uniref:potassium channel family protein n=1 Tax=unclassified Pseudoalteromonas TaxID=194690 RepID=UPI000C3C640B|nr:MULTISPECIES: potassium channel family protein [unclassified Pseudoalteromonas]MBD57486.1 potassium channel protein [Pseudoalteromonas sp.]MBU77730.1 potassium channel protein [Pseudoalteromonadaceae bacterium]MCF2902756.1 ion channel [Pseudoalteromonas sp. OFAV1]MCO7249491.1 ion channel [Pseudoalteromonas sp. Ps84H-4]TGV19136.1 two pore domain potassium channel family protein [Pseudoalteromonas sp. MEBiC 03607]|tara:strand:- start:7552 stop:8616 length:1065 start_codon:yes stop_codon:yes gene_type:complete
MHYLLNRIVVLIRSHIDQVSWQAVVVTTLLHMLLIWWLLMLAGEQALTPLSTYVYYYVVTTSTVGYGDFSASTELGRWIVALLQIPFGLALFGVLLGKTGQTVTYLIRRAMTGDKSFAHINNHIIIFGWHDTRTKKMVDYILADQKRLDRRILLAVTEQMEHPFLTNPMVDFARLSSFTDLDELQRIAIERADKIIIDGQDDDQTFTTALRISKLVNKDCHISAHFTDETKIEMLHELCHNVECSSAKSAEILVRSMQDPGSSRVQEELLSTLHGDTQFSLPIPKGVQAMEFGKLFHHFKYSHDAILLGVAHNLSAKNMDLNPPLDYVVSEGDILHYIAAERVLSDEVDWSALV